MNQKGVAPIIIGVTAGVLIIMGLIGFRVFQTVTTRPTAPTNTTEVTVGEGGKILNIQEKDQPIPEAPKGFSWYTCKGFNGKFLKPDGWSVHEFQKPNEPNTYNCNITKDKDNENGGNYGLGIIATKNATQGSPVKLAEDYVNGYKKVLNPKNPGINQVGFGQFAGYTINIISQNGNFNVDGNITALGNYPTRSFYTIAFFVPVDSYEQYFLIGKEVTTKFVLDPQF